MQPERAQKPLLRLLLHHQLDFMFHGFQFCSKQGQTLGKLYTLNVLQFCMSVYFVPQYSCSKNPFLIDSLQLFRNIASLDGDPLILRLDGHGHKAGP